MTRVDYEAAWTELADRLSARDGWGTKAVHSLMADVAAENRVSETFLERSLRMYGGEITLVASPSEAPPSGPGGTTPTGPAAVPDHSKSEGGRDGEQHAAEARAAA